MFKFTELPQRPFKNFIEYLSNNHYNCYLMKNDINRIYGCVVCNGKKNIVDPKEISDPIEGFKNAERIPCPRCNGRGFLPENEHRIIYKNVIDEWKERYNASKKILKKEKDTYNKIKSILNEDEMKTLGLL